MERIQSIEVFRVLAVLAVIAIHTTPFDTSQGDLEDAKNYLFVFFNQSARFAVPLFFIISGYFFGFRTRGGAEPVMQANRIAKRIGIIFVAWTVIYLLPYDISSIEKYGALGPFKMAYWNFHYMATHPLEMLLQGSKGHLWFLPSLIIAAYMTAFFIARKQIVLLLVIALLLFIIGVLGKAYATTPVGIEMSFNTRKGPFFGLIFFVTGYMLSGWQVSDRWLFIGLLFFLAGLMGHMFEIYYLWNNFQITVRQEYVFCTYFMGLGTAMMALSGHQHLSNKYIAKLGKYTLGIYTFHFMFVEILGNQDKLWSSPIWELGYVLVVFVLSVVSTHTLARYRYTRRIVV